MPLYPPLSTSEAFISQSRFQSGNPDYVDGLRLALSLLVGMRAEILDAASIGQRRLEPSGLRDRDSERPYRWLKVEAASRRMPAH